MSRPGVGSHHRGSFFAVREGTLLVAMCALTTTPLEEESDAKSVAGKSAWEGGAFVVLKCWRDPSIRPT